jgi:arginase
MSVDKSINIGGDHSIAIGTGAASLNKYRGVKFIWIDAHADINTYDSSLSKSFHGMPLSYLTGLDYNKSFPHVSNKLKFDNIYYAGIRDLDPFEWKTVIKNDIKYSVASEINAHPEYFYKKLSKYINNSPIHISFDVDSIDPKYIPSTGTPVSNGLELNAIKSLMDNLMRKENVVGLDIVEMNTDIDDDKTSVNNFKYVFADIVN